MKKLIRAVAFLLPITAMLFFSSCDTNSVILNNLPEREANEIVVFLASKGIPCQKVASAGGGPVGGTTEALWNIAVNPSQATEAMAILNRNGLPRVQGTNLLKLFAKSGLMTSEKEEQIRYQAGLAEQLANMIRQIDGVVDAYVQLSFPSSEGLAPGEKSEEKITAAVFVKHQGALDDPNMHLVTKIKRLISGSVTGLDLNDVTVISDKARFADVYLGGNAEMLTAGGEGGKDLVSIWSIVMNKNSASRFRALFFTILIIAIILAVGAGWLIWKFYPMLREKGLREIFQIAPMTQQKKEEPTPHSDEMGPPENKEEK